MPTQLKTRCPQCQATVKVAESHVGQRVRCPACKQAFEVSSVEVALSGSASLESAPLASETMNERAEDTTPAPSSRFPPLPAKKQSSSVEKKLGNLGRFQLQELLGQGAFGKVYRAHDPQLDRFVALKVPTFGPQDTHKVQRFIAEAKAAAKLRHPNIVPTYESGQIDGQYYIAAQFVAGQPLSSRIKEISPSPTPPLSHSSSPLTFRQSAEWLRQLADGLAYAHKAGIVHRDIKPDNIMLDEHDVPHIMDFGLAKRLNDDAGMTTDGSILGTPAYMAPEQARGEHKLVGPQSDQYSLGVVLYQLLTGKKPFEGSPHSVIAQVIAREPPLPRSFNKEIPRDLEAICQIAMSKEISQRYPSCADMSADLARWLGGYETLASPLTPSQRAWRWCRRNALVASLLAAVGILLLFGLGSSASLFLILARNNPPAIDGKDAPANEDDKKTDAAPDDSLKKDTQPPPASLPSAETTPASELPAIPSPPLTNPVGTPSQSSILRSGTVWTDTRTQQTGIASTLRLHISEVTAPTFKGLLQTADGRGYYITGTLSENNKISFATAKVGPFQQTYTGEIQAGSMTLTHTGTAPDGTPRDGTSQLVLQTSAADIATSASKPAPTPAAVGKNATLNPKTSAAVPGAFVVLRGDGSAERKFDTLAEAVLAAGAGDTIEIRSNGPFVTAPVKITAAVTIRAASGSRPVIVLSAEASQAVAMIEAVAPLVLEGVELRRLDQFDQAYTGWHDLILASNALRAANCRFVLRGVDVYIGARGPQASELRNCEFLHFIVAGKGSFTRVVQMWPGTGLVLNNCLVTGGVHTSRRLGEPKGAVLSLTHNTFRIPREMLLHGISPSRSGDENFEQEGWAVKALQVQASDNVFATDPVVMFNQQREMKTILPPGEVEALLARVVGWQGERNAYARNDSFLGLTIGPNPTTRMPSPKLPTGLTGWKQLWGTTELGSVEGPIRFQGGDPLIKTESALESITPDDFRLGADSAGYRAGQDGKDLGADVNLVGPGPAYERWKQTPGYQEWLKDTALIVKPPTTVVQPPTTPATISPPSPLTPKITSEKGFVSMFDGKTLKGWRKAVENPQSFQVKDRAIVAQGPQSHLYYEGDGKPFKNFHFICEVKTTPLSNSGIYFHTRYQMAQFPTQGLECQIDNSSQAGAQKTGSIYDVVKVGQSPVEDDEWFKCEIIVEGDHVVVKINDKATVDYTQDMSRLVTGTFALQAHHEKAVYFRNLRVKRLEEPGKTKGSAGGASSLKPKAG